ncbi:MAG: TetR/AcrR family transcriptional regulator C-terminal domain-containing protein [Chloroflexi bacterium]|nr:TetR/AcrR family transcriptional regulator C-terminal domain-containing protein [Chloroflexota bacterium]
MIATPGQQPVGALESAVPHQAPGRGPLSRERVLTAALRLVDEHSLEALSMRRLGAELGVEAMSLYHHVPGKDALLDGLAERLWAGVRLPAEGAPDWKAAARPIAKSLRQLAQEHPNAYPLLLARATLPEPALRVFDTLFRTLRGAGFDPELARHALGALVAYATGHAMVELACGLGRPDLAAQRCVPPDASGRFADLARALGECNPDRQFDLGLEAMLDGLEARRQARGTAAPSGSARADP